MQDVLTWGALIASGSSIVAIVTFWMNRGKAEAEATAKADAAAVTARTALAKAEFVSEQLAERASNSPATMPATRTWPPPTCATRPRSTASGRNCAG